MQQPTKYPHLVDNMGFSIAELMVAVGVFAVVMAVAVPNYLALRPERFLNGGARNVLVQLMWAKSLAVQKGNRAVVMLPNNTTLQILDDTNNNGVANTGEAIKAVNLQTDYPGVTVTKSGGDATFYPRGIAAGTTTYTVANSIGSKVVTVSTTGNVTLD